MRDVIDKFKLRATIDTLDEKGLLFPLIQKFSGVDLHPDRTLVQISLLSGAGCGA